MIEVEGVADAEGPITAIDAGPHRLCTELDDDEAAQGLALCHERLKAGIERRLIG